MRSTGTRLGGQARGRWRDGQEMRMTAVPFVTARQCPRPASGVQRPRVPVHVAAVHCPVRASGRSRCPASDVQRGCPVSVRSRVHCVRPGGRGRPRWGGQPHTWMAGVVVVVSRINGRLVVCPDRTLAVEPGAGHAGQRRRRLVLGRRGGRWLGVWSGRLHGDQERPDVDEDHPVGRRAGVRSEAATTLGGRRGAQAESPGRCEPPGLDCDLRVRPWCGRSMR
jgi:hypothetical protein